MPHCQFFPLNGIWNLALSWMYRYDEGAGKHELGATRISSEFEYLFVVSRITKADIFVLVLLVCKRGSR